MKKIVFLLICFADSLLSGGQDNNFNRSPITLQSPDATQFIRYGNIPVDYSTGVPNISIPLYNVTCGKLSLPIDISYNASGIKVLDIASTVGLGWSLNAGGLVSKTVLGSDDKNNAFKPDLYTLLSQAHANTTYNNVCEFTNTVAQVFTPNAQQMETQSDRYFYSFNGRSGIFRFDFATGVAKTIPYSPLKIIVAANGTYKITDEDGTNYYFEQPELTGSSNAGSPSYMSYYLTRIESADLAHTINIHYKQDEEVDQFIKNYQLEHSVAKSSLCCYGPYINTQVRDNEFISISIPVMPDSITSDNETVLFQYIADRPDLRKSRLSSVQILNRLTREPVRAIEFQQSYFGTATDNNQRLRLNNVNIKGNSTATVQQYGFGYNSTPLPPYYHALGMSEHHNVDYWGYYNGADDPNLLPRELFDPLPAGNLNPGATRFTQAEQQLYGGNRNPNPATAQACMLTSMTYPTGGTTSFEYELNEVSSGYSYIGNPGSIFGGLRVKKITSTANSSSPPVIKSYNYQGGFHTMIENELYLYYTESTSFYPSTNPIGVLNNTSAIINTDPLMPMNTGSGPIVIYNYVTEYDGTETNNNGYTEYTYDNSGIPYQFYDPGTYGNPSFWGFYLTDYGNYKPQLIAKVFYGKDQNNAIREVKTETYTYHKYNTGSFTTGIKVQRNNPFQIFSSGTDCDIATGGINTPEQQQQALAHLLSLYQLANTTGVLDVPLMTEKKETMHPSTGTGDLVTTTNYTYDLTTLQPISEQSINSKGETVISLKKYPGDFAAAEPYTTMVAKNILTPVIEQVGYKNAVSSQNFLKSAKTNYDFWNGTNWSASATNFIMPKTIDTRSKDQTAYETRQRFYSYDDKGNPTSIAKENDSKTSYIWGHNKSFPIAQALNANSNEIFFDGLEEPDGWQNLVPSVWPNVIYDKTKSHSGKYSGKIVNPNNYEVYYHSTKWLQVQLTAPTKFKYSGWFYSDGPQVEMLLFMKRAGETAYLTYVDVTPMNTTGKWVYVEKEYTVPADVVQLNIRVDNNSAGTVWFDDIRLHPSTAQMTTYTYNPLTGMTSQCDANNRITNYEYDSFGRLYLVRDQDGKIVKKLCYNYYGQTSSCEIYGNEVQQRNFTRTCTGGAVGSTVTYTVAANTYSAGSLLAANTLATNDVTANGQNYADQNGTCTIPPTVTVSGQNTTGTYCFVQFTNTATNAYNSLYLYPNSTTSISLPAGTYNISFSETSSPVISTTFRVNAYSMFGTSASFSYINITSGSMVKMGN